MNRLRLFSALLAAAGILAVLPPSHAAAALVNRASMALTTSYLLKASVSYSAGTVSAVETISVKNVSGASISKLNLSVMPRAFGELTSISGFRVDGRTVAAKWTNNSNLELQLGRNVANLETAKVSLAFSLHASGRIDTSLEARLSKANGILQVSNWFPIISDGHGVRYPGDSQYTRAARLIRLELTTESSGVRIAAPGRRISVSGRSHIYELDYGRDLAFGASPSYKIAQTSAAGVVIGTYTTTGNASAALSSAAAAFVKYESAFGQYRWPRFIMAQTGRPSSGNEFPGIVFLGGPLFANREVVVHEAAHQWWYAMVGNDQLREPWLDEGWAQFAASYFFAGFEPYVSTKPVNSSIYDFPNIPAPSTSSDPNSYDQTVYFKAARFLNGLRSRMGTTKFFDATRALFAANRNGVVTTREFYDTFARYGASKTYMQLFIRL